MTSVKGPAPEGWAPRRAAAATGRREGQLSLASNLRKLRLPLDQHPIDVSDIETVLTRQPHRVA